MKCLRMLTAAAAVFLLNACNSPEVKPSQPGGGETQPEAAPLISYTIGATVYPHDTTSFTEGLLFHNGKIWESTGEPGHSHLYESELATGKAVRAKKLDSALFGEGIVILRDTVYQLTYQNQKALLYDMKTLNLLKELPYKVEGWGFTTDSTSLIASDGSNNLYFYEPGTLRLMRTQGVTENGNMVPMINELEWVNGYIYANVWQTNFIVKIDPKTGFVVGRMNLEQLDQRAKTRYSKAEWLNGIAYNPETKKFYVTGKNWPELYELQFSF